MKNIIKYYYGLDVTNIIYKEGYYKMIINKNNYLLCPASKKDLLSIESYLVNNYNFHEIIPTLNNDITIFMNNGEYVLLKLTSIYKRISLDDILSFNYPIYSKSNSREKWISLWSDHIDYIEYQINELSNKYPTLSKYIYYYIGLAENAIELLNMTNIFNTYDYLMHRKIKYNMDLVDFYNPTLIIVDSRVRDISEYYKSLFFVEDIEVADILEKINESIKRFNEEELILFMARMLYPTYFFDCYDRIIGYGEDEKIIYPIRDRALEYEKLLKEIYLGIKKATHIENIEWLSQ